MEMDIFYAQLSINEVRGLTRKTDMQLSMNEVVRWYSWGSQLWLPTIDQMGPLVQKWSRELDGSREGMYGWSDGWCVSSDTWSFGRPEIEKMESVGDGGGEKIVDKCVWENECVSPPLENLIVYLCIEVGRMLQMWWIAASLVML